LYFRFADIVNDANRESLHLLSAMQVRLHYAKNKSTFHGINNLEMSRLNIYIEHLVKRADIVEISRIAFQDTKLRLLASETIKEVYPFYRPDQHLLHLF
jgi:hypothetical protein